MKVAPRLIWARATAKHPHGQPSTTNGSRAGVSGAGARAQDDGGRDHGRRGEYRGGAKVGARARRIAPRRIPVHAHLHLLKYRMRAPQPNTTKKQVIDTPRLAGTKNIFQRTRGCVANTLSCTHMTNDIDALRTIAFQKPSIRHATTADTSNETAINNSIFVSNPKDKASYVHAVKKSA